MKKIIEIKNLNYTYPDGKQALKNINLDIFEGESVGIIGPNGAGKTTLLLHLNGILRGKGFISVFGNEINNGNLKIIRSKVGLVFQNPDDQLFSLTVFDDIAFGLLNMNIPPSEIKERINKVLKDLDLINYENLIPHHLSLGEKKRVSLATILVMEPEILVLDEPTSNLDPYSKRHLISILKKLKITKIIASHDLEMVLELTDRVILLNKGEKITEGKSIEILSNKNLMEANLLEVPLSLVFNSATKRKLI
jgi:cobalt/nickel transport system ATP-binding protein